MGGDERADSQVRAETLGVDGAPLSADALKASLDAVIDLAQGADEPPLVSDGDAPLARDLREEDDYVYTYLFIGALASGSLLRTATDFAKGLRRSLEEPVLEDSAVACARGALEASTKAWYLVEPGTDPVDKAMRAGRLFVGELGGRPVTRAQPTASDEQSYAEKARRYYSELQAEAQRRGYRRPGRWNVSNEASRMLQGAGDYQSMSRVVHASMAYALADLALGSESRHPRATRAGAAAAVALFLAAGHHARYVKRDVRPQELVPQVQGLITRYICPV